MSGPSGRRAIGAAVYRPAQAVPISPWTRATALFVSGVGALAIAQLALGCELNVVALSVLSVAIGFLPLLTLGSDLYTLMSALIAIRYTGAALVFKTVYGQTLELHLQIPAYSYLLTTVIVLAYTATLLVVRRFDRGTSVFPRLPSAESLRAVGLVAFLLGATMAVLDSVLSGGDSSLSTGSLHVVVVIVSMLIYFGYVAEAAYMSDRTSGRDFVSSRLIGMLSVGLALTLLLNARSLMFNAVISVFVTAILYRSLRLKHLVVGSAFLVVFSFAVSPIALELRTLKEGKSASEFAEIGAATVTRALVDPRYLAELRARNDFRNRYESGIDLYDYYGDAANIENRFSFVAIVDAVAFQLQTVQPIGARAFEEVIGRTYPRFLGGKAEYPYGYGDWLTWQIGLIEDGRISYFSFPLPTEGLALFGLTGMVVFPVVVFGLVVFLCARVSSFRYPYVASLFIFGSLQWLLFEGPSESLISIPLRVLPVTALPLYALYWFAAQQRAV